MLYGLSTAQLWNHMREESIWKMMLVMPLKSLLAHKDQQGR